MKQYILPKGKVNSPQKIKEIKVYLLKTIGVSLFEDENSEDFFRTLNFDKIKDVMEGT